MKIINIDKSRRLKHTRNIWIINTVWGFVQGGIMLTSKFGWCLLLGVGMILLGFVSAIAVRNCNRDLKARDAE